MPELTRPDFLKLMAAGGASFLGLQSLALANTPNGPLVPWGRLKYTGESGDNDDWHVHPNGDINLMDLIRNETTANMEKKWNVASISDLNSMVQYPFLFMHGEVSPVLDNGARQNLKEYFLRGGFLYAEDCVVGYNHHGNNKNNDFFFRTMAQELPALLPGSTLQQLPNDHPVFNCFYHFTEWPHMQGFPHGPHGLMYNGRMVALLSPSDLHCGWTNGDVWFGPGKQRLAMQMGANIYIYAMTRAA